MEFKLLSTNGGKLSRKLHDIFLSEDNNLKKIFSNKLYKNSKITRCLIATYSPTLMNESFSNYQLEVDYYKKIIKNLTKKDYLIFISSQTLELTNITYYSRAKYQIEQSLKESKKNFTIIRPGMIFNSDTNKFTLKSMQNSTKSFFTFYQDIPKTTVCSISDIYETILTVASNYDLFKFKTINLGIKKYTFLELQNFAERKFRIAILPFCFLMIFSMLSVRLRAYVYGEAIASSPLLAIKGSYD
tara:strand:- start:1923 stop:2654 length:732 start_codon:yes stop_codon:yes gene_type:complete